MTFYAPVPDQRGTLLMAELRGQELRRFTFDPADPARVTSQEIVLQGEGRLRDVAVGPDRCLYVLTSNRDTRGTPRPADDQVLKLCPR
jgi:quinoprotein glucose dehydrogenase